MSQRTAEVEIAGKKVVIKELTFDDSLAVDSKIPANDEGMPSGIALSKVYALASVQSVDGVPLRPAANEGEWRRGAAMFSAMDGFALAKAYNDAFPSPTGADLKNESSDPA